MPPSRRSGLPLERQQRLNKAAAVVVPLFVTASIIYTTYVDVDVVCNQYLIHPSKHFQGLDVPRHVGSAIAILVIHFVLLVLMLACYIRILGVIATNPGFIPSNRPRQQRLDTKDRRTTFFQSCAVTRTVQPDGSNLAQPLQFDRVNILSGHKSLPPGAEAIWHKDEFVCDPAGLPNYCEICQIYKPDRTHHSSDVGRCARRMDHFCPWVGGMVCERNHKFFYQFLVYACCFSVFILVTMAYFYTDRHRRTGESNGHLIAALALAAMFTLFTVGMVLNSGHLINLGLTTVESLDSGRRVFYVAILIPRGCDFDGQTITYPLGSAPGPGSRTFAVLETPQGKRPWDLGTRGNWKDLMGSETFDWLLPIRYSPFCKRDRSRGEYEFGPVVARMKRKAGLTGGSK